MNWGSNSSRNTTGFSRLPVEVLISDMAFTSIGIGPTKVLYKPPSAAYPLFQNSSKSVAASRWLCVGSVKASLSSLKGGGGAVLERPNFDQSQPVPHTQVLEGGDIGRVKDKRGIGSGDSYRVLLIDDIRHTEKLVAKVLPQVVPSVTPDDARKLFHQSRENGMAVVIVTVKEHAEFYAQMMVRWGLRSTIEPDSTIL